MHTCTLLLRKCLVPELMLCEAFPDMLLLRPSAVPLGATLLTVNGVSRLRSAPT